MKYRGKIVAASVLFSFIPIMIGAQQSPRDLFERARLLDENNQDLAEAIRIYARVAADAKDQPPLAARALLQMGRCQERLGQADARKAYQRVIDEYPGQAEEVRLARERLAALAAAPADRPKFRKIEMAAAIPQYTEGALSPDGEKVAFVSGKILWTASVRRQEGTTLTGTPTPLTSPVEEWHSLSRMSVSWSRDSKWLAVRAGWANICLVPATGGEPRRLDLDPCCMASDPLSLRSSLSPDMKSIAYVTFNQKTGETAADCRIFVGPLEGGAAKPLTERLAREPAYSPDGGRIAYIEGVRQQVNRVWIQPLSGEPRVPVCEIPMPGRAFTPVWSPRGDMLAVAVGPGRPDTANEMWIVPLTPEGKADAPPTRIPFPSNTLNWLAGWDSADRLCFLTTNPEDWAIYTVAAAGGMAARLTPGEAFHPVWSPDGQTIFFQGSHRGERSGIEFIPARGGDIKRIPIQSESGMNILGGARLSPDGTRLVFLGEVRGEKPARHLFTIPAEGGKPTLLASQPVGGYACWSSDGSIVAFYRMDATPPKATLCTIPAGGGDVRRLAENAAYAPMAWSPDGKHIAFAPSEDAIGLLPVEGGEPRVVVNGIKRLTGLAWSPDGKELAYVSEWRVWRVSRDGGAPREVQTGADARPHSVAWSPDGQTLAFGGFKGGGQSFWLVEDFMRLVKRGR